MGPVHGVYLACPNEPSIYITGDTVLVPSVSEAIERLEVQCQGLPCRFRELPCARWLALSPARRSQRPRVLI
jgi:hypothetical protein